jgi:hypothetical protein
VIRIPQKTRWKERAEVFDIFDRQRDEAVAGRSIDYGEPTWPWTPWQGSRKITLTLQKAIPTMETTRTKIRMSCTKVGIRHQQSDFSYWQSRPYQERLATLEEIRREFHQWRYGAEPRFQRVYTIVKQ